MAQYHLLNQTAEDVRRAAEGGRHATIDPQRIFEVNLGIMAWAHATSGPGDAENTRRQFTEFLGSSRMKEPGIYALLKGLTQRVTKMKKAPLREETLQILAQALDQLPAPVARVVGQTSVVQDEPSNGVSQFKV